MTRCAEVADDLQSFVNGSLIGLRRILVARHLEACPDCRQTADSLCALRRLVTSQPASTAPSGLSNKLTAIAGDERQLPLWLAKDCGRPMPSARARRRKLAIASSGLLATMVSSLVALGWAYGPDVNRVDDLAQRATDTRSAQPGVVGSSTAAIFQPIVVTAKQAVTIDDCPAWTDCPPVLSDELRLVAVRVDAGAEGETVFTEYRNPRTARTVVVAQERGQLDGPARTDTNPAVWQSGSVVVAVSGSDDAAVTVAVGALLHEPPVTQTTAERIKAGWSHLLGR